ncbi:hypothetical protein SAMD00019534_107360 [Acytostelium subglobosum LB1]|uniref:hypothetical protein n=1 Tax=Acytostelium subglobosum LB1 TaxID=1410327 RepID=UPI000644A39D|nr:hypothetical protein SAMD00019534_107360 [Acytostelium subglobosum LB1]GAM27560.1 hypothetical protein SAMD00019534_107360 [Acytostelium subglobosum LB1]|eukprot:XP_012749625.1 hypothetical protein SAMD00019534_107360 [Acytostelium subglobosum LB1]
MNRKLVNDSSDDNDHTSSSSSSSSSPSTTEADSIRMCIEKSNKRSRRRRYWRLTLLFSALLLGVLIYFQPNVIVRAISNHFQGEVVFYVDGRDEVARRKLVTLTIDDAPSPDTMDILDILAEYDVKATFFLIGKHVMRKRSNQNILDRMLDQGHELGNHMWQDEPSITLESKEFERQLIHVDQIINRTYTRYYERYNQSISSTSTSTSTTSSQQHQDNDNNNNILYTQGNSFNVRRRKLFRPGSGFFNRHMLDTIGKHGYQLCLGNVYPHDPFIRLPSVNSWYVTATISPGSVIILHDRTYTMPALRTMLPQLIAEGYQFVTLSQLLDIDEQIEKRQQQQQHQHHHRTSE